VTKNFTKENQPILRSRPKNLGNNCLGGINNTERYIECLQEIVVMATANQNGSHALPKQN